MIVLKSMSIYRRDTWEDPAKEGNHLIGTMEFRDSMNGAEFKVPMDESFSDELLKLVADKVVLGTQRLMSGLSANIIAQSGVALPAPTPDPIVPADASVVAAPAVTEDAAVIQPNAPIAADDGAEAEEAKDPDDDIPF